MLRMTIVGILLAGCSAEVGQPTALDPAVRSADCAAPASTMPKDDAPLGQLAPDRAGELIGETARQVVQILARRDLAALADYVQPDRGVRFSPYGYVDTTKDRLLSADDLRSTEQMGALQWGRYDGSGEPIELTVAQYFERFVYAYEFAQAPQVGVNHSIGRGNSLDNAAEAYPDGIRVEYHFPGFDPAYSGLDWRSLRLVFVHHDGCWYLAGIISDQWTV